MRTKTVIGILPDSYLFQPPTRTHSISPALIPACPTPHRLALPSHSNIRRATKQKKLIHAAKSIPSTSKSRKAKLKSEMSHLLPQQTSTDKINENLYQCFLTAHAVPIRLNESRLKCYLRRIIQNRPRATHWLEEGVWRRRENRRGRRVTEY